jgi:hypothetical protein
VRRLLVGVVCVALTAALAPAAAAKGRVELRSGPPKGLHAGETWTAHLLVHATARELATSAAPTILIHNRAAGWTEILATPVAGDTGAYTAAVVFPAGGTWTYHVHDPIVGGGYDFPPTVVASRTTSDGAFPPRVALGSALGGALLAAAVVAAWLRRRI